MSPLLVDGFNPLIVSWLLAKISGFSIKRGDDSTHHVKHGRT